MRLAFLCGSLEPGRDGVGDYTRRLAGELIRQGHPSIILALNDKYKPEAGSEKAEGRRQKGELDEGGEGRQRNFHLPSSISHLLETQRSEGTNVECLRLPGALGWTERVELARQWLEDFNPDWVSLQYVCYGYHPKGLAWRWNRLFAELGSMARHRHLMFHELWIDPPPWHRQLLGMVQQWIIHNLHRHFRPDIVTTSMTSFQQRLSRIGIMARVLPLFGNIPIASHNDERIHELLREAGCKLVQQPRNTFLNGIFFGTVHPNFNVAPLIRWLAELRSRTSRPVLLSMIGRGGPGAEVLAKQLVSALPDAVEVVSLGEQPEATISQVLQFADFGINTGSPEFLGKSGTFAAMREHGLPVVLADGELDSIDLQSSVPPVLQFSNNNSVSVFLRSVCLSKVTVGAAPTLANLIQIFEKVVIGPRQTVHP